MGLKSFLKSAGLVQGKYNSFEGDFNMSVSLETVEQKFADTMICFKAYGSAWKLKKIGSSKQRKVTFELFSDSPLNCNTYTFIKTGDKTCHANITVKDPRNNADQLFERDKKLLLSIK